MLKSNASGKFHFSRHRHGSSFVVTDGVELPFDWYFHEVRQGNLQRSDSGALSLYDIEGDHCVSNAFQVFNEIAEPIVECRVLRVFLRLSRLG